MSTKRRRGRPNGYPTRKKSVLRTIADEVLASGGKCVLTRAVRSALVFHRCNADESTVSDHRRSFRRHELVLLEAARKRRCPPPTSLARVPVSYARTELLDHVRQMGSGLGGVPGSKLAHFCLQHGLSQPSPMEQRIHKDAQYFQARMLAIQDNPTLAAVMRAPHLQNEEKHFWLQHGLSQPSPVKQRIHKEAQDFQARMLAMRDNLTLAAGMRALHFKKQELHFLAGMQKGMDNPQLIAAMKGLHSQPEGWERDLNSIAATIQPHAC